MTFLPSPQGDGDPGTVDHAPLIDQLDAWVLALEDMLTEDEPSVSTIHSLIAGMRQVAADLAREDEARQ